MGRILDLEPIIQSYDTLKVKGKEYKVGAIKTKTLLEMQKLLQDNDAKPDDQKMEMVSQQVYLILKQDNTITKEEIDSWGLQAQVEFLKWFNEPFLDIARQSKEMNEVAPKKK
jgi:hypothetical protein